MLPIAIRRRGTWYDPAALVEQEFNRLFRRFAGELPAEGELTGAYPVDIHEDEGAILVDAEMPGFKREEIQVSIENSVLTITAERKPAETKQTKHLTERRFTRVERAFTLPAAVDEARAEAALKDGVLHLRLPKSAESKPRKIEVKEVE